MQPRTTPSRRSCWISQTSTASSSGRKTASSSSASCQRRCGRRGRQSRRLPIPQTPLHYRRWMRTALYARGDSATRRLQCHDFLATVKTWSCVSISPTTRLYAALECSSCYRVCTRLMCAKNQSHCSPIDRCICMQGIATIRLSLYGRFAMSSAVWQIRPRGENWLCSLSKL